MRVFLRLFGSDVFDFQIGEPEYDESDYGIAGAGSQNFERDTEPIDPSGLEPWGDVEETYQLGFRP